MAYQLRGDYSQGSMTLALNVYNCPSDYPSFLQLNALRYLFGHATRGSKKFRPYPRLSELSKKACQLFDTYEERQDKANMAEAADILVTFTGNRELLRRLDRPVQNDSVKGDKTVYNDSQNVHNHEINQSVIQVLTTLYDRYEEIISPISKDDYLQNILVYLCGKYPAQFELIETAIDYIQTSVAIFGPKELTMTDAIIVVWLFILAHEHADELEKRLLEEMKEMHGLCTTGHVARLMNVIQGFTDDDSLRIRISDNEQCRAVVKAYLNKVLAECDDEKVHDGLLTGSEEYKQFIREKIAETIVEWRKTYGQQMLKTIAKIVNDFAHAEVFTLF